MSNRLPIFIAMVAVLLSGCCASRPIELPDNRITQIATIDALLSGVYDGWYPVAGLIALGDTGIGTFDRLDGEMIIVDGKIYKAASDGKVYSPRRGETTPFAAVAFINPDAAMATDSPVDFSGLRRLIDRTEPNMNLPVVIRIQGEFVWMKVRSVPRQQPPYPQLAQVTAHQPVFEYRQVKGDLVGFRLPAYVKGINVPGYHVHFLAESRDCGGHVLDFTMAKGRLMLGAADRLTVLLPRGSRSFAEADLNRDRSRELERVEK